MIDQTQIQMIKILASQSKVKTRKPFTRKVYPKAVENRYRKKLASYFKPLIDYVDGFLSLNMEELLRGDSREVRLDTIPGTKYREMIRNLQKYLLTAYPTLDEMEAEGEYKATAYIGILDTAEDLKNVMDKTFMNELDKALGVSIKSHSLWWDDMKKSWADSNYNLIRSNASAFVNKINVLVEQAIVNGQSPAVLKQAIKKATVGLSDTHCKLIARDQIAKFQGQITEQQMTEIGLDMYVWDTSNDERVRESHAEMQGLLCRWDDPNLCSYDGGKTWVERPSGAVRLHPGQDIQCRCVALSYFPQLLSKIKGLSK